MHEEQRLRLAVVGLGKAGLRHLEAARANPRIELVAVADSSPEARSRAPEDMPALGGLDEVMATRADAVVIALPHGSLAGAAHRALEAGCHVLVEKPMALDLSTGRELVQTAQAHDRRLMVNYNHRFRDEYRTAKRLVVEGRLGVPRLFSVQMMAPEGPLPQWVWDPAIAGGGMMTYNGAHVVDHLLWLADQPVREVWATMERLHFEERLEDTCVASLRFEDGAMASVVVHKSNVAHRQGTWEMRVSGRQGAMHITGGEGVRLSANGADETHASSADARFERALDELASAVFERRSPSPNGDDGLRALACLEALYESASTGEWVRVETEPS